MTEFITAELLMFIAIGFAAQLVDGALGMAYGLITTTVLLSLGTPPAFASASVHAAEVVTTGLAGASHVWHKNIDWHLLKRLAPAGVAGGILGAYILTGLPETFVKVMITFYLIGMTLLITRRIVGSKKAQEGTKAQRERKIRTPVVGAGGGFLDAIGGGGWGPVVASTLLARGDHPRSTIGSVSLAEFFLTVAVSVTFMLALDFSRYWSVVLGLVIGGAMAAPLAGYLSRILAPRTLMILVAAVISILSVYNLVRLATAAAEAMG
ncbi:MAG TPA: sulfite exporter TauE/SafE family protein [Xanthobacteraceae bacterium]|nr:sulfite exporter TauE/SafE family protein [Xanthobacteraceae bacterium]